MTFSHDVKTLGRDLRQAIRNLAQTPGSPGYVPSQTGGFAPQQSQSVQSYPLTGATATVTLDGSGNGKARIAPGQPGAPGSGVGAGRNSGLTWDVSGVSVSVGIAPGKTAIVNEAQASAYVSYGIQANTPAEFQGQTAEGSHGDTCSLGLTLKPGDWITVAWAGGDANAIATMTVIGTVNPPGV